MDKRILDANVIIRFLRADHKEHSAKATVLFEQAEQGSVRLVLHEVVVAEVIWVLTSFYECARKDVADTLLPLVRHGGIECENATVVCDALERYKKHNVDFMDCLLAAHSAKKGYAVSSFDRDFKKFKDVKTVVPGS